jgi:hypothetical protein
MDRGIRCAVARYVCSGEDVYIQYLVTRWLRLRATRRASLWVTRCMVELLVSRDTAARNPHSGRRRVLVLQTVPPDDETLAGISKEHRGGSNALDVNRNSGRLLGSDAK